MNFMKRLFKNPYLLCFASLFVFYGCGSGEENKGTKTSKTKEEEKTDPEAIIWMDKNLAVEKFRNGDPIPEIKSDEEWKAAQQSEQPGWCYYDNDPKNGEKYGKLYNWYAVNDPRGLAPEGWKIPSKEEFKLYVDALGKDAGTKMKSTSGWHDRANGESGNGTNESGFNGLPGGYRDGRVIEFTGLSFTGDWWTSTESGTSAWHHDLSFQSHKCARGTNYKRFGFSVRCIKE